MGFFSFFFRKPIFVTDEVFGLLEKNHSASMVQCFIFVLTTFLLDQ